MHLYCNNLSSPRQRHQLIVITPSLRSSGFPLLSRRVNCSSHTGEPLLETCKKKNNSQNICIPGGSPLDITAIKETDLTSATVNFFYFKPSPDSSTDAKIMSHNERLLLLRKAYQWSEFNRMAPVVHQDFLANCLENNLQPKCLRLKIPCLALAASETKIEHYFDIILQTAQKQLLQSLLTHHNTIEERYEASTNGLIKMMNVEAPRYSEEQRKHHEMIMRVTNANLNNKAKKKLPAGTNKWVALSPAPASH